ncbi:MAG: hypothetical protein IJX52_00505 [Oscillibacter sp.]|nr:hypothetical protein [Oscillibacter sp.]
MASNCEECLHYDYDDETESYYCTMDLDEDEMERFLRSDFRACPFYRLGDDYSTAAASERREAYGTRGHVRRKPHPPGPHRPALFQAGKGDLAAHRPPLHL